METERNGAGQDADANGRLIPIDDAFFFGLLLVFGFHFTVRQFFLSPLRSTGKSA